MTEAREAVGSPAAATTIDSHQGGVSQLIVRGLPSGCFGVKRFLHGVGYFVLFGYWQNRIVDYTFFLFRLRPPLRERGLHLGYGNRKFEADTEGLAPPARRA